MSLLGKRKKLETDIVDRKENQRYIVTQNTYSTMICGCYQSISLGVDNVVYSCGSTLVAIGHERNDNYDDIPFTLIPSLIDIKMVNCSLTHTACVDYSGQVFTFGENTSGELGIGKTGKELSSTCTPQKVDIPPIDILFCGCYFTLCLSTDGTMYSFGSNQRGELGIGSDEKVFNKPQQIQDLKNVELIQCGDTFGICKLSSGDIFYSWGFNKNGELGLGNNINYNKPMKCSNWPTDIISIKSGQNHSLLLDRFGYVYSFGENKCHARGGQLGLGDDSLEYVNTPTLIKDLPLIKRIECGYKHSMCIDMDNNLWVFGHNHFANLGLNDRKSRYKPTLHPKFEDVIDISSGGEHTFVKIKNNIVYGFGDNSYSKLGIETIRSSVENPIRTLKGEEDIWITNSKVSKQKSARK